MRLPRVICKFFHEVFARNVVMRYYMSMEEQTSQEESGKGGNSPARKDRLGELRKTLYRREVPEPLSEHSLREKEHDLPPAWDLNGPEAEEPTEVMSHSRVSKYILIFSVVFFFIALGVAAFVLLGGSNIVSSQNIGIEVSGPVSIAGGEELSLQISIKNDNTLPIEFADLLVEYPEGTRSPEDVTQSISRFRKSLGTIGAGEVVHEIARSVLFGEEQSTQPISITLEYRVQGSNAIFVKETSYDVVISSSPLRVIVTAVDEVSVNQEMTLEIVVESASEAIVGNVAVKVDYPFGFEFKESSLSPIFAENTWALGDIPKGGRRTVRITGVMKGQGEETKVFRITSGTLNERDETQIGIAYSTLFKEVALREPFLGAKLSINRSQAAEVIASPGDRIQVTVDWENTLPVRITDAVIEVSLSGNALNPQSVQVSKGIYDSSARVVRWDQRSLPELGNVESGEQGSLLFYFSPRSFVGDALENPYIELSLSVRGKRISETTAPEEVRTFITRIVRFISDIQLSARAVYFAGPFANRGPLPPKAETETTYTIIWTIVNSSNEISNAHVSATLPGYMRWFGIISPQSERIAYNPESGEIRWDVGTLDPGVGFSSTAREVAFQVGFFPSANQVGEIPELLLDSILAGRDRFADVDVEVPTRALSTSLSTDPNFSRGQDRVVE